MPECIQKHVRIHEKSIENKHGFTMHQNLKKQCTTVVKTLFLGIDGIEIHEITMQNQCKYQARKMYAKIN